MTIFIFLFKTWMYIAAVGEFSSRLFVKKKIRVWVIFAPVKKSNNIQNRTVK